MAFQVKFKQTPFKVKVETIECFETSFYCSDSKGTIYLGQIVISDNMFSIQVVNEVKATKKKIDKLSILNTTKQVLCLCSGKLSILDPISLTPLKVLKNGITTYAISESDDLAIAIGKKLRLFSFNSEINDFEPYPHTNEITTTDTITKLSTIFL